jgi:osmotically inducible protein OsmC
MTTRNSTAIWHGDLSNGAGVMRLGSGLFEGAFTRATRFEQQMGTNPEELIGAAHAGCFSMHLSSILSKGGHTPILVDTSATVHLGEGPTITLIELSTEGVVPGINQKTFAEYAERAKKECPVSKALASVEIKLTATLLEEDSEPAAAGE